LNTVLTSRAKPQSHLACLSFTRRRRTRIAVGRELDIHTVYQISHNTLANIEKCGSWEAREATRVAIPRRPEGQRLSRGNRMNFRVADIQACYELWKSRGAEFITEPIPKYGETRCYIRDPDGYIIEVGQSTDLTYG
jgi:catechol 2,3-dioxygenase-like lactoylglutathione lyase family enzyme